MLSLTSTNRVTFAVNVFGTASTPSVRCVVGEAPAYSFPASKLSDGQYEVLIDLPKDLRLGTYPFKVEVLLNGRLFTPINQNVPVTGEEKQPASPTPAEIPAVEKPAPSLVKTVSTPQPDVEMPAKVEAKVEAEAAPAAFQSLETLAKTPVFGKLPPKVEIKRVKISMAEVAATAEALEKPKKPKAAPKKAAPIIEARSVPVSLTKGAVIYR